MASDIIATVHGKIALLRAEIMKHQEFLRLAESLGYDNGEIAPDGFKIQRQRAPRKYNPSSYARAYNAEMRNAVHAYIAEHGPSITRILLPVAQKAGFSPTGNAPSANLSARLSLDAGLVNLPGHGYWIADMDYPALNYVAPKREAD